MCRISKVNKKILFNAEIAQHFKVITINQNIWHFPFNSTINLSVINYFKVPTLFHKTKIKELKKKLKILKLDST